MATVDGKNKYLFSTKPPQIASPVQLIQVMPVQQITPVYAIHTPKVTQKASPTLDQTIYVAHILACLPQIHQQKLLMQQQSRQIPPKVISAEDAALLAQHRRVLKTYQFENSILPKTSPNYLISETARRPLEVPLQVDISGSEAKVSPTYNFSPSQNNLLSIVPRSLTPDSRTSSPQDQTQTETTQRCDSANSSDEDSQLKETPVKRKECFENETNLPFKKRKYGIFHAEQEEKKVSIKEESGREGTLDEQFGFMSDYQRELQMTSQSYSEREQESDELEMMHHEAHAPTDAESTASPSLSTFSESSNCSFSSSSPLIQQPSDSKTGKPKLTCFIRHRSQNIPKEKPFTCTHPGCNKAYAKAAHLNSHSRIHTGNHR